MKTHICMTLLIPVLLMPATGCGPRPPIPYQQLQIQDMEESRGYDVYMYISVQKELSSGDLEDLLKWFRDVKFRDQNKIRIFVWDNPQSALINALGDMIGSLDIDREAGIDEIKTFPRTF